MGWIDVTSDKTVKFFSLSDSVEALHDYFFAFWSNVTPGMFLFIMLIAFVSIAGFILYSIYAETKRLAQGV